MKEQNSYIEFTTQIGCVVACLKYCPQELIVSQYVGERVLTLDIFKKILSTVPKEVDVFFSGRSEPFQNQETIDMIEWAHQQGHAITIFTTLTGLLPEHAKRLVKIPLTKLVLHLPDAYRNAKIPNHDPVYQETRAIVEDGIERMEYMNMGGMFLSNLCEGMARNNTPTRRAGRRACFFLEKPGYQVQPNGEVSFCCMVRGLSGIVGNLNTSTYPELAALHPGLSYHYSTDPESMCHRCVIGTNWWVAKGMAVKDKILNGKSIKEIVMGV